MPSARDHPTDRICGFAAIRASWPVWFRGTEPCAAAASEPDPCGDRGASAGAASEASAMGSADAEEDTGRRRHQLSGGEHGGRVAGSRRADPPPGEATQGGTVSTALSVGGRAERRGGGGL